MGQLLHWTSLRYVVPTGVPHMSVSLFSRPYSSVSAPCYALGLSLCRPSETTYCLFEPFKKIMWRLLISHSSPTLFSIDHVALRSSPSSGMPHLNILPSIIRMWPRPCLYFQCLFVICPTCIQTNGSFEVSLCFHYVSLRVLVLASHSVHACYDT